METSIAVPTITTEIATGTINIALTKEAISIQKLSDAESKLVFNEDNLPAIRSFLDEGRKAKRILESLRVDLKEPYFQAGKRIDEAAKAIATQLDALMKHPSEKLTQISQDIEKRAREAEADRQRKQAILSGIDSNMVSFSQRISDCKTDAELLAIERLINLEKGYKKKYAEFFEQAVEKYNTLTSLLTLQKERVREMKELEKQRLEAENKKDDEALMKIHDQQVGLDAKIEEAKVTVQEAAVNQTMNTVVEAKEILPEVKARNTRWDWEVIDIKETAKKMPVWCEIIPVDTKINEFMKAAKDGWNEDEKEEIIVNGIKFYLKKTY